MLRKSDDRWRRVGKRFMNGSCLIPIGIFWRPELANRTKLTRCIKNEFA